MAFMRLLIVLLIFGMLMTSGCITEENSTRPNQGPSTNVTDKAIVKNEPDIKIASYYFVYIGDNNRSILYHEKNYVAFNLSIHNDDPNPIHFRSNDLQLHGKNRVFNISTITREPIVRRGVWEDFEKKITIGNDIVLLPNETIKGYVLFEMEDLDVVSNRSFSLRYNGSLITSASFEKSLMALTAAELFNYSTAFGIPAYEGSRETDFYPEINYYYIWPNWVNRSVVEYYKKTDPEYLTTEEPSNPPGVGISYLVRVLPQRNIMILPGDRLVVVDDTGEELMNRSIHRECCGGLYLAIRHGETYEHYIGDVPQMNIKNATVVRFSFSTIYGWGLAMRISYNNQDVILDEDNGIVLAQYEYQHFIS